MDKAEEKIAEIRKRVIELERPKLEEKAKRLFPEDLKRQEAYVYRTLNARYGYKPEQEMIHEEEETIHKKEQTIRESSVRKGALTLEEVLALPLEGCEITFTIGSLDPIFERKIIETDN